MASQQSHEMAEPAVVDAGRRRAFATDLKTEFARLFRPPRAELASLAVNAVAVTAAWTLLPPSLHAWLFSLTGPMAFAVVLEAWMLGDTPTTNVLGNDVEAALTGLPDAVRFRRLIRVKAVAMACLVGVCCAVVAAALAVVQHAYVAGALLCAVLLVAPLGAATVAQWVGVRWPYHPRLLRWRWQHRRPYGRTIRWLVLIVVPYAVVPCALAVFIAVGVGAGLAVGSRDAHGHLETGGLALGALLAMLLAVGAFVAAPRVSLALARRHRSRLTEILADPEHG